MLSSIKTIDILDLCDDNIRYLIDFLDIGSYMSFICSCQQLNNWDHKINVWKRQLLLNFKSLETFELNLFHPKIYTQFLFLLRKSININKFLQIIRNDIIFFTKSHIFNL